MFKRIVVFTTIVVAFPLAAGENPEQGQWLLSILSARTETPAEHGLGSGTSPGLAVGYGLTDSISAEISYQHWAADNGDGSTGWVSGIWSLPKGTPRLQPYVVLGAGRPSINLTLVGISRAANGLAGSGRSAILAPGCLGGPTCAPSGPTVRVRWILMHRLV